jgi:hypothetical protein
VAGGYGRSQTLSLATQLSRFKVRSIRLSHKSINASL